MRRASALTAAFCLAVGTPGAALAGEAWDHIRAELYGARAIAQGAGVVTLTAPYRATDDRAVPIGADVRLPGGQRIRQIALVIDENPMPVSAVFDLQQPRDTFAVMVNMRLNGPSDVRAVVEAEDGTLWMAETRVKTSGLGACAAPPVTDPAVARATIGQMTVTEEAATIDLASRATALATGTAPPRQARLAIRHPSHSGMQMDQISLLYIPAHFIETVEVWDNGAPLFRMTGSISLSENPEIVLPVGPASDAVRVRVTDTEGGIYEGEFALGAS